MKNMKWLFTYVVKNSKVLSKQIILATEVGPLSRIMQVGSK
jgi:hypothetical protein